jgi:hypothetical protein
MRHDFNSALNSKITIQSQHNRKSTITHTTNSTAMCAGQCVPQNDSTELLAYRMGLFAGFFLGPFGGAFAAA